VETEEEMEKTRDRGGDGEEWRQRRRWGRRFIAEIKEEIEKEMRRRQRRRGEGDG
jgi:hypothetical protein